MKFSKRKPNTFPKPTQTTINSSIMSEEKVESLHFLEQLIEKDLSEGKNDGRLLTRFPPEPNGYLHIGHAKSIYVNFSLAQKYGGKTNLRFDDTNPVAEDVEYVDSIKKDIAWLGYDWGGQELYASDYFDQIYAFAVKLIKDGKAYVDPSTSEEMAAAKGNPSTPATPSPYRDRSVEENLDLFERMKAGEFDNGAMVLRAKVDLESPNMLMRDPIIYRILKTHHHRTGDKWCIYPMYDFAHGQSDAIENITHSICTLEFIHHRPLYNWFIENLGIYPSKQHEFARLNLNYTVMSKRRLRQLVEEKHVAGWDDPRMPTLSGLRRRGYTPEAIRNFIKLTGVAKRENIIDVSLLEFSIRKDLNKKSARVMVVLNPLKMTITNFPEGETLMLPAINNPEDESMGSREIPFSNKLYIEQEDFMVDAPKKFFRLGPGKMVRLKNAFIIRCDDFVKDETGEVIEVKCTYFPESKSGSDNSGLKAKGVLHWVSAEHAKTCEVRIYDRLFSVENPMGDEEKDFKEFINPNSLEVIETAFMEPALAAAKVGDKFQFMRKGYFAVDPDSTDNKLVFNRTVSLKDGWAKKNKK